MGEKLSHTGFRMMALTFAIYDLFSKRTEILKQFGIEEGMHVVDYGCGPGSYIPLASKLVGPQGLVSAVDIHPLAIQSVNEKAFRKGLTNVMGLLAPSCSAPIDDHSAHIVYALDMFHMVERPTEMLGDIRRILTPEGSLFIDPGHQSVESARQKIIHSRHFSIAETVGRCFRCHPERSL